MEHKKGFTLIELVIAMAVSSILILGLIYVLSTILKAEKVQNQYVDAQDALRIVSLTVEKDIRQSSQDIEIRTEGLCTYITDNIFLAITTYCLEDSTLKVNDGIVSENVVYFALNKIDMKINMVVHSEFREDIIEYEKTIFLR